MIPVSWKWGLVAAFLGMALWSLAAVAAKIDRFTDQDGTLHITNAGKEEPIKPGVSPSPSPSPEAGPQPQVSPQGAPGRPALPGPSGAPPGGDPRMRPQTPAAGHHRVGGPAPQAPNAAAAPDRNPRSAWPRRMPGGPGAPPVPKPENGN